MWRSSSNEGSSRANGQSNVASGQPRSASRGSSYARLPVNGIRLLEELEEKYLTSSTEGNTPRSAASANGEDLTIHTRIRMIRKLVELRGERILNGVDPEEVIWLDGTSTQSTTEGELTVSWLLLSERELS